MQQVVWWKWFGLRSLKDMLALQDYLVGQKYQGSEEQWLLFCEHPPCFTYGYEPFENNLRVSVDEWRALNVPAYQCIRGGAATFHGPGQLVCYAVFDFPMSGFDVLGLCSVFEKVVAEILLHYYGLLTSLLPNDDTLARNKHARGLWVRGEKKILSRGMCVQILPNKHYVTSFGFALNISVDLHYFDYIRPCGLDIVMTSLAAESGCIVSLEEIVRRFVDTLSYMAPLYTFEEDTQDMSEEKIVLR